VLFLSHVTSPTAVILPIQPLIQKARESGIWTVIDGAHAPGQIDVDVRALGVDFYGGNCHKWLSAPKGAGFLYVRPEMQNLIQPLVVSWGWRPRDAWSTPFVDTIQRQATHDIAAYLSVPAAIDYQREHDWPAVRKECHELVRLARQQMAVLTGVEPMVSDDPRWFAQMSTLSFPSGTDPSVMKERLYDEYHVEIPISQWGESPYARISVQGYNTRADVERLIAGVKALLTVR
jgi:isopenicillin-N epimerase